MKEVLQLVVESMDAMADDALRTQARQLLANWLPEITETELDEILEGCNRQAADTSVPARSQLRSLLGELAAWLRPPLGGAFSPGQLDLLKSLYLQLDTDWQTSQHVLLLFSLQADDMALRILVELLVDSPPPESTAVAMALAPLFASPPASLDLLFPRLLEALAHPPIAAAILDMANYLTRKGLVDSHPAGSRVSQLETLLHGLNRHLEDLQEPEKAPEESLQQIQSRIADSIALAISLCDAMALIGSDTSAAVLRITCQRPHRRLRTEAAAALARLGDQEGCSTLLGMAAEPVVRLRVIQYAEELGIDDQLEPALVMPAARRESEMALWLSRPENIGIPPSSMHLVDQRTQYWPGFEEPVECFLFQFCYQFANGEYRNTGIAAPLTAAVHANLDKMTFDDIYALFAGGDVEHEEIHRWEVADMGKQHQAERNRLQQYMEENEFEDIQPELFMQFFSDGVLVAQASQDQQEGLVVSDFMDCLWFPEKDPARPLAAVDALNIYAGKKLLETFNA